MTDEDELEGAIKQAREAADGPTRKEPTLVPCPACEQKPCKLCGIVGAVTAVRRANWRLRHARKR